MGVDQFILAEKLGTGVKSKSKLTEIKHSIRIQRYGYLKFKMKCFHEAMKKHNEYVSCHPTRF